MSSEIYKALVVREENGTFHQSVETLNISDLPQNDVLIRVHYSSLNYKDALSASGNKGVTKSYPFTPGIDAVGVVEQSLSDRFRPGDRVIVTSYDLGMNTPGGFGQYIRVPSEWVIPLPGSLTLKESMMIGTSGLTAATGVEKILQSGRLSPEDDVLVTGATGAVGSFAVALLGHLGYTVTAATGKTNQAPFLRKIGASSVIHRDEVTTVPDKPMLRVRWKAGVETVGGSMLDAVLRQTKHNGVVTCCGNVLGHELQTSIYPFILRGVSLMGIDTGIALMEDRLRLWGKLADGWKLPVLEELSREVQLENMPKEIAKMLEGGQAGKVLVSLPR